MALNVDKNIDQKLANTIAILISRKIAVSAINIKESPKPNIDPTIIAKAKINKINKISSIS